MTTDLTNKEFEEVIRQMLLLRPYGPSCAHVLRYRPSWTLCGRLAMSRYASGASSRHGSTEIRCSPSQLCRMIAE